MADTIKITTRSSSSSVAEGSHDSITVLHGGLLAGLEEISKISNEILEGTEASLAYERRATLQLRGTIISIQRDARLMCLLISKLPEDRNPNRTSVLIKPLSSSLSELLSTLQGEVSNTKLASFANQLRTTDRKLHGPIVSSIDAVQRTVEDSRLQVHDHFRSYWIHCVLASQPSVSSRNAQPAVEATQVPELLAAFDSIPFGIGALDDRFLQASPSDRGDSMHMASYRVEVEEAGRTWIANEIKAKDSLWVAYQSFLHLLWNGAMKSVDNVDTNSFRQDGVEFSEFQQSRIQFSDNLRDSILRGDSSVFTLVFVGAEDSGKSTFLNSFMGIELLPSAGRSQTPIHLFECLNAV